MKTLEERFEEKCIPVTESGCWLWLNSLTSSGYGKIYYEGKLWLAHRVSYLIYKGKIPKGNVVMHRCDNKLCVNPEHLLLGTHKDNTHDMMNKGRGNLSGEFNSNNKLTKKDVLEIKDLLRCSLFNQGIVANFYNVTSGTISAINTGKIWKDMI